MFEECQLPKKLDKSPIKKVVIEIRYKGRYPEQALYGLLMDEWPNIKQTPLYQLPVELRENDANLKYQTILEDILRNTDNTKYIFGIGNNVIQFIVLDKYVSWNDFFFSVKENLEKLINKNIIEIVDSLSLQYINIFEQNIVENINVQLIVGSKTIKTSPMSFSCVLKDGDKDISITVGTPVNINGVLNKDKSLMDIRCSRQIASIDDFKKSYETILASSHNICKKYFVGLIKEDLLKSLGPENE
ncbi:MAG: TIGR04255 family protein [Treponema sp.]|nr:TIGR04255 family protein [Treponema sp.]